MDPSSQIWCLDEGPNFRFRDQVCKKNWRSRFRGSESAQQAQFVKSIAGPLWAAFAKRIARRHWFAVKAGQCEPSVWKAGFFERKCRRFKCQDQAELGTFLPSLARRIVLSLLFAAARQSAGQELQIVDLRSAGAAARILLRVVFAEALPVRARFPLKNPEQVGRIIRQLSVEFFRIICEQAASCGGWEAARNHLGWPSNLVALLLLAGKEPAPCLVPSPRVLEAAFDEEVRVVGQEEIVHLGFPAEALEAFAIASCGKSAVHQEFALQGARLYCEAGSFAQSRFDQRVAGLIRRREICVQFTIGGSAFASDRLLPFRDFRWLGGDIISRGSWFWQNLERSGWFQEPRVRVAVELQVEGDRVVVDLSVLKLRIEEFEVV